MLPVHYVAITEEKQQNKVIKNSHSRQNLVHHVVKKGSKTFTLITSTQFQPLGNSPLLSKTESTNSTYTACLQWHQ